MGPSLRDVVGSSARGPTFATRGNADEGNPHHARVGLGEPAELADTLGLKTGDGRIQGTEKFGLEGGAEAIRRLPAAHLRVCPIMKAPGTTFSDLAFWSAAA